MEGFDISIYLKIHFMWYLLNCITVDLILHLFVLDRKQLKYDDQLPVRNGSMREYGVHNQIAPFLQNYSY